ERGAKCGRSAWEWGAGGVRFGVCGIGKVSGALFVVGAYEVRAPFAFFVCLFSFIPQLPIPKPHAFRIVFVFSPFIFFFCRLLGVLSAGPPSRTPRPTIKSDTAKENGIHSPHSLNNPC
ncbi:uncharacterized protein TM35_000202630, partial [Trypanosoma theileri]